MSTYLDYYHRLGQGYDSQCSASYQEGLLLQAWGEFWHNVMAEACPPPDSALVLVTIRTALECARIHRNAPTADQMTSASELAQAIQVQTTAVLQWCDDRGLVPSVEIAQSSKVIHSQEALLPQGHSMPESSAF